MWKVQYREYLEFADNKAFLQQEKKRIKEQRKEEKRQDICKRGVLVEENITTILKSMSDLTVKELSPQMDIGFGADLQISYKEDGKNYSFFVDITADYKNMVEYFTLSGELVENADEAFVYQTEYFGISFGLKPRHMRRFFYEKPVVVLQIRDYTPCTGLAIGHLQNISQLMRNLNMLMVERGYGARASQLVMPNLKKYHMYRKR